MAKVYLHEQSRDNAVENGHGARLTVNCPSGTIVSAVCDDTEYTVVSDSSNKAVFERLYHGTWKISSVNSVQIKPQTINIVTNYDVVIDFFTATIVIEYPKGSSCICTNGVVTYTAPDTSGLWHCIVNDTGVWTITCSDDEHSKTCTVEITHDDSYVDILLAYFTATINVIYPEGAVCSCSNANAIYSASDTSGEWTFVVYEAGDWIITVSDDIQTVTSNVNVSYDGQVENTIVRFFESTINITYPEGAICTCTDGSITYTAPNTSGRWIVTVPRIGVWTIRAVRGNSESTQVVSITESGQGVSVLCEFFISFISVTYPVGTFKTVLHRINDYGVEIAIAVDTSGDGHHIFEVDQVGSYKVSIYRVAPYAGIESESKDYSSEVTTISDDKQTVNVSLKYVTVPEFTYTGTYKIVNDDGEPLTSTDSDWMIMFNTTGNLRFTKLNGAANGIDVFVLGGGGNGGETYVKTVGSTVYCAGGGGGGGGHRSSSFNVQVNNTTPYEIVIGGSGGSSSAFGVSASGGSNGGSGRASGATGGGEGGDGGSKGGNGGYNAGEGSNGEDGTYAFMGTSGYLFGAGGGGGYGYNGEVNENGPMNYGGKDGGGNSGENGHANSGGGGGGENQISQYSTSGIGKGGSGVVIIRNKRY